MTENEGRILVVDDDIRLSQVLAEGLTEMGFDCQVANEGTTALRLVRDYRPEAMVIDIRMPDVDGIEVLRRARICDPDIAAIMLTALDHRNLAVQAMKYGASDYLVKPVRLDQLCSSLQNGLEKRKSSQDSKKYQSNLESAVAEQAKELDEAHQASLMALVAALDIREGRAASHSHRITQYALAIADRMGATKRDLEAIRLGGPLHDVGKIGIPDAILLKPGSLTPAEMAEIRKHPRLGYQIVNNIKSLEIALPLVLYHHERWDGTGYPRGLKQEAIPLCARIIALADVYDALTMKRVYKSAIPHHIARGIITEGSGKHFDPRIVNYFLKVEPQFVQIKENFAED